MKTDLAPNRRTTTLVLGLLALQACSTTAPRPTAVPPANPTPGARPGAAASPGAPGNVAAVAAAPAATPPAAPAPPVTALLVTERQWLQSWFKDTPVLIAQRDDGPVNIEVPREFCFDAGRSTIKPALAAVLDKVAESLRRTPQARLPGLAAPGDAAAGAPLALQRANGLRAHLISRGVPAAQVGAPATTTASAVQLRLELAPQ